MPVKNSCRRTPFPSCPSILCAFALLLFLAASPGQAQLRERGPLILDLPASTSWLAQGQAFNLGARDSDAIFHHPGLLSQTQGMVGSFQSYGKVQPSAYKEEITAVIIPFNQITYLLLHQGHFNLYCFSDTDKGMPKLLYLSFSSCPANFCQIKSKEKQGR